MANWNHLQTIKQIPLSIVGIYNLIDLFHGILFILWTMVI